MGNTTASPPSPTCLRLLSRWRTSRTKPSSHPSRPRVYAAGRRGPMRSRPREAENAIQSVATRARSGDAPRESIRRSRPRSSPDVQSARRARARLLRLRGRQRPDLRESPMARPARVPRRDQRLLLGRGGLLRVPRRGTADGVLKMRDERAPRLRWIAILGGAGFAAGFFGPLVFVPEANQGSLVGILITGPVGALLGVLLLGVCSLLGVS